MSDYSYRFGKVRVLAWRNHRGIDVPRWGRRRATEDALIQACDLVSRLRLRLGYGRGCEACDAEVCSAHRTVDAEILVKRREILDLKLHIGALLRLLDEARRCLDPDDFDSASLFGRINGTIERVTKEIYGASRPATERDHGAGGEDPAGD